MSDFTDEAVAPLEAAVLGAVITDPHRWGERFRAHIDIDQFGGPRLALARLLDEMLAEGLTISSALVLEEARQRGLSRHITPTVVSGARSSAPAPMYVEATMDALSGIYLARGVWQAGVRLQQATNDMSASDALLFAENELARLRTIEEGRLPTVPTLLTDVLAADDPGPVECHIPDILPTGAAVMVTASEGAGKSVMLRQLAIAAALGIDPFNPQSGTRYEPRRVMIVDAEVSQAQLQRSLRSIWTYGSQFARRPDSNLIAVESAPGGLDIATGTDRSTLLRLIREHRPDVLAIGPLYRITGSDLMTEEGMRVWQRPFEPLKGEGMSLVMEHHAGNEAPGHARALRPIGSSAVRRWFSQGIGLRLLNCSEHGTTYCCSMWQRRVKVEHWRGARDEVNWPTSLVAADGETWWEEFRDRPQPTGGGEEPERERYR